MGNILAMLEEIRAIALTGLNYDQDEYNRERYQRLLRLAVREYASLTGLGEDHLIEQFRRELGYITPKTGGNGAIFDDQGRVLLVRRSDNGRWCLPGGYAEVNLSPQENVRREVREETGLEVEVGALVDVFHVLPGQYGQPNTNYIFVYLCHVVSGTLATSHETPEVGYFDYQTITDWHSSHRERTERAYHKWLETRGES